MSLISIPLFSGLMYMMASCIRHANLPNMCASTCGLLTSACFLTAYMALVPKNKQAYIFSLPIVGSLLHNEQR